MSAKHEFIRFFPSSRHSVEQSHGCRLSIVYFTPNFLNKLTGSQQDELEQFGFRVRELVVMQQKVIAPKVKGSECSRDLVRVSTSMVQDVSADSSEEWFGERRGVLRPSLGQDVNEQAIGQAVPHYSLCDQEVKRVTFANPEIEELVEFEVQSLRISTRQHKEQSRTRKIVSTMLEVGSDEDVCYESDTCQWDDADGMHDDLYDDVVQVHNPDGKIAEVSIEDFCEKPSDVAAYVAQELEHESEEELLNLDPRKASHTSVPASKVVESRSDERVKWLNSVDKELGRLHDTGTLEPLDEKSFSQLRNESTSRGVPLITIPAQLLFVIKADGSYKCRFVCCGNFTNQIGDTATRELDSSVFRLIVSWGVRCKHRFGERARFASTDVATAFLNATLLEDRIVVVRTPWALGKLKDGQAPKIFRVRRALYGLKESPRLWGSHRDEILGSTQI
eukprot:6492612-Amphidinium_carterae.1